MFETLEADQLQHVSMSTLHIAKKKVGDVRQQENRQDDDGRNPVRRPVRAPEGANAPARTRLTNSAALYGHASA